jgi:hypothetical protein
MASTPPWLFCCMTFQIVLVESWPSMRMFSLLAGMPLTTTNESFEKDVPGSDTTSCSKLRILPKVPAPAQLPPAVVSQLKLDILARGGGGRHL